MLMVQRQTGQARLFGGARHEILQVGHADVGLELVHEPEHPVDITSPVPKQRHGTGDGGTQIHLVVLEHRAQIGQAPDRKFRLQDFRGVIVGHKEKFMAGKPTGNGQAPHGVPMPGAVNAVKYARHGAPFCRISRASLPTRHNPVNALHASMRP